jgi:hypothetical protein
LVYQSWLLIKLQFIKGSDSNIEGQKFATAQMAEKLGHDPVLCEMLIPKWDLGCRRVTPGPGYLESFRLPNCHLTNSGITKISENAVHTADGKVHEVDVGQYYRTSNIIDAQWLTSTSCMRNRI